jgi:predicted deacetylase
MDADRWQQLEQLFDDLEIKPIVAVVPDNRDRDLVRSPDDPGFWLKVRRWQDKGWSIAMHGYQHLLMPTDARLVLPFYRHSEFAGLSLKEQSGKLRTALSIFTANGVRPGIWVAPAHCFDRTTLRALAAATPIRTISDGIARKPYLEDGFMWLPQQLWKLTPKIGGVWTVCLHPNSMSGLDVDSLRSELSGAYRRKIARVAELEPPTGGKTFADHVEDAIFWQRHRLQGIRRQARSLLRA